MSKITDVPLNLIITRDGPEYPPHHLGDHLEEYFIKFWQNNGNEKRKLIPIHWTAVYNYKHKEGFGPNTPNGILREKLRNYLKSLNQNDKYFIVCTHDDAPIEELPSDTLVFAAGGNSKKIDVPIPLICGPHKDLEDPVRTIPISFVGSLTHPIRNYMANELYNKPGVYINASEWNPQVPKEKVDLFKQITERSIFSLCPRGYGATSYRLYESMQLGAIPIYVSDKHLLPWNDEIDWNKFSFIIKSEEIKNILQITLGNKGSKILDMQNKVQKFYENYFTIQKTCENILKRVK